MPALDSFGTRVHLQTPLTERGQRPSCCMPLVPSLASRISATGGEKGATRRFCEWNGPDCSAEKPPSRGSPRQGGFRQPRDGLPTEATAGSLCDWTTATGTYDSARQADTSSFNATRLHQADPLWHSGLMQQSCLMWFWVKSRPMESSDVLLRIIISHDGVIWLVWGRAEASTLGPCASYVEMDNGHFKVYISHVDCHDAKTSTSKMLHLAS